MSSVLNWAFKKEDRFAHLPVLGAGLGYRPSIARELLSHRHKVDFLELIADHYFDSSSLRDDELAEVSREFPVVLHAIAMSIGTALPVDEQYLTELARVVCDSKALWVSDHLCFTKAGGVDMGQLTPLPFTEESVAVVCENVSRVKQHLNVPFLLENITYYFAIPGAEMSEAEFITSVVEGADCGLLLDLTNLHTNATNHGYDAHKFLESIPLERVMQIHLAGGTWMRSVLIDSHSSAVPSEVWGLLEFVRDRAPIKGILIERDENFPPFSELIEELDIARSIMKKEV